MFSYYFNKGNFLRAPLDEDKVLLFVILMFEIELSTIQQQQRLNKSSKSQRCIFHDFRGTCILTATFSLKFKFSYRLCLLCRRKWIQNSFHTFPWFENWDLSKCFDLNKLKEKLLTFSWFIEVTSSSNLILLSIAFQTRSMRASRVAFNLRRTNFQSTRLNYTEKKG